MKDLVKCQSAIDSIAELLIRILKSCVFYSIKAISIVDTKRPKDSAPFVVCFDLPFQTESMLVSDWLTFVEEGVDNPTGPASIEIKIQRVF